MKFRMGTFLLQTVRLSAFIGMLVALQPAQAQTVADGGFEVPAEIAGVTTFSSGSTFGSWTVGSGNVDLVTNGLWDPHSGNQSLDLNGSTTGSIFQSVTTTLGQSYTLSFWMAGNPDGAPAVKSLSVSYGGASEGAYTFDTTGHSDRNMGWTQHTVTLIGAGTQNLTFTSTTIGSFGPTLDDISLTSNVTPEPGSIALFASMSIAGAGLLSRRARLRK